MRLTAAMPRSRDPHRGDVVGEQPHEGVEPRRQGRRVEPAPAGVAFQNCLGAQVFAQTRGLGQHFSQGGGVLQPHVQALTRHRMHAVSRVADQGDARRDDPLGQAERQRIDETRPLDRNPLQKIAETPHQMGVERRMRRVAQGLAPPRRLGPD